MPVCGIESLRDTEIDTVVGELKTKRKNLNLWVSLHVESVPSAQPKALETVLSVLLSGTPMTRVSKFLEPLHPMWA
ncbi:MAG: hypothetical protein Fur0032_20090 [Terrimicrobiaceae bacterium]